MQSINEASCTIVFVHPSVVACGESKQGGDIASYIVNPSVSVCLNAVKHVHENALIHPSAFAS